MEVSRVGNRDMIQLLMEFGADPNTVNGVSSKLFLKMLLV